MHMSHKLFPTFDLFSSYLTVSHLCRVGTTRRTFLEERQEGKMKDTRKNRIFPTEVEIFLHVFLLARDLQLKKMKAIVCGREVWEKKKEEETGSSGVRTGY